MSHRDSERRSLAYHRAIAARLPAEPRLIELARQRVEQWLQDQTVHPRWATSWVELLRLPVAQLVVRLVEDSQQMVDLRQSTPFAGALSPQERWAIWRATGPDEAR